MTGLDSRGREVKFIFGHGNRGRKFPGLKHGGQFTKGFTPWNKGISIENAGTYKKGHLGLRGVDSPMWRGGITLMTNGYLVNNRTKQYIHREIMEKEIGRKLATTEHVHHLNHDKTDDRLENLRVISQSEHGKYHANTMWSLRKG